MIANIKNVYQFNKMFDCLESVFNRRESLEKAIEYGKTVLRLFLKERYPEQWAIVQMNLGNAHSNRISGERKDNIEENTSSEK